MLRAAIEGDWSPEMIKDTQGLPLGYLTQIGSLPAFITSDSAEEHMDRVGEFAQSWNLHL